MARHPMSSSWPQLTARTSVSGQSSTTRVSSRGRRADGSVHDHDRPRRAGETYFHAVHGTGALSLWMGVQLRVSSRSHPMPCTAIRFRALLVTTFPVGNIDVTFGTPGSRREKRYLDT